MTPDTFIPALQQYVDSLGAYADCRSDNEKANHVSATDTATRCMTNLRDKPAALARMEIRLTDAKDERDAWLAKQAELTTPTDDEQKASLNQRQLQLLRQGLLWNGPDRTYGQLGALEARVEELTARRDLIKQQLQTWITIAEQLLTPVS